MPRSLLSPLGQDDVASQRRAQRLLVALAQMQEDDAAVTPQILMEVKYRFRTSDHCSRIKFRYEPPASTGFIISHSVLPRFILSQVEAQRLTSKISSRESILALLFFIKASLPPFISSQRAYPTLFRWHCEPRHRTYCIFAYLNLDMPAKSYTIDELLALRLKHSPGLEVLSTLSPELATVIVNRQNGNAIPKQMPREEPRRENSVIMDKKLDSSSDDEVVFKGKLASRRVAAASAIAPKGAKTAPAATDTADTSEMEWKYSGRSASGETTNEPVSAPTGVPAQKNEGFQRFYKAVVSPTHVRVTAGGRIVPNTRGPPSPTSKRGAGDAGADANGAQEKPNNNKGSAMPPLNMGQPGMPPYFPAFSHGFPPMAPFMPMPYGPMMPGGFPIPPVAGGRVPSQPLVSATLKTGDGQADKTAEPKGTEKTTASRPEQFDATKSFAYTAPWMFPFPPHMFPPMGAPFMPGPMLGPHPFMGHPPLTPQMETSSNTAAPPMGTGSFPVPMAGHPGFPGLPTASGKGVKDLQPPAMPPISSIRPSDITKNQIGSFRAALKYHQDQLQYNRHQIDEKFMESKVKAIQEHIRQFEALLRTQLEHEEKYYPKPKSNEPEATADLVPAAVQNGTAHELQGSSVAASSGKTETGVQQDKPGAPHALSFRSRREMSVQSESTNSEISWGIIKSSNLGHQRPSSTRNGKWRMHTESTESTVHSSKASAYSQVKAHSTTPAGGLAGFGVPYLVGTLPKGVNPRTARDTDYQYPRELTEEESRARHLYWGKAPDFVRQGLPRYDGKHFYPPAPLKEDVAQSSLKPNLDTSKSEADPFLLTFPAGRQSNQGNRLRKARGGNKANLSGTRIRSQAFAEQDRDEVSQQQPSGIHKQGVSAPAPPATDAGSVSSRDKRSDNPVGSKLWQAMLQKSSTSSAVSSTTAQGYLPQYVGYAARSLSPSVGKKHSSSSNDSCQDPSDLVAFSPVPDNCAENRLLHGECSLEYQFRNVVPMDVAKRGTLSPTFSL